jgi:hypothetical protein
MLLLMPQLQFKIRSIPACRHKQLVIISSTIEHTLHTYIERTECLDGSVKCCIPVPYKFDRPSILQCIITAAATATAIALCVCSVHSYTAVVKACTFKHSESAIVASVLHSNDCRQVLRYGTVCAACAYRVLAAVRAPSRRCACNIQDTTSAAAVSVAMLECCKETAASVSSETLAV